MRLGELGGEGGQSVGLKIKGGRGIEMGEKRDKGLKRMDGEVKGELRGRFGSGGREEDRSRATGGGRASGWTASCCLSNARHARALQTGGSCSKYIITHTSGCLRC